MRDSDLLDYVLERLPRPTDEDFTDRLAEIAKRAKVPYHTLLKIAKRETSDPRVSTIQNLITYFREREAA